MCPPPFDGALAEALALCRTMWREGHAESEGPAFPVAGARHHPRPRSENGPAVALDLTGRRIAGEGVAGGPERAVRALADFVVLPTGDPAVCRMEPA